MNMNIAPALMMAIGAGMFGTSNAAHAAASLPGYWITDDKSVVVGIDNCRKNSKTYCGIIVGIPGAKTDHKLRSAFKQICGAPIIWDVKRSEASTWDGGKILDLESGKSYEVRLRIKSGKLNVRAYQGSLAFGETYTWKSVKNFKPCKPLDEF